MAYLRNTWYVAAWANELAPGKLLARRLLDTPVVLFRDSSGKAHALQDRCPHRLAPLSRGHVAGEAIQCGYHGLQFNGTGACVHNPHGPIPRAAQATSYSLAEKHYMLWIWMGDPALADTARIPDFAFQDPDTWYTGTRYLHVKASYVLEVENIMDLSHIEYLHPTTLASPGVSKGVYTSSQEGDVVWSKRFTESDTAPDALADAMCLQRGTLIDRWMDVRWHAPGNMALFGGGVPTGRPRSEGVNASQVHCFTPETGRTSHYWFGISFPLAMGDIVKQMAEERIDWLKVPFETEDLPMLESQQRNMDEFGDPKLVLMAGDSGGVKARRVLERMIATEEAARAVPAHAIPV